MRHAGSRPTLFKSELARMILLRRVSRYLISALIAIAFGATSVYLLQQNLIYTLNNRAISALTTSLFILGLTIHLAAIYRVDRETRLITLASNRYSESFSTTRLDEVYNCLPSGATKSLINDLRLVVRENKAVSLPVVQELLSSYSLSTSVYLQFLAATALLLGLLGTFMGIIQAINSYATILPSATGAMVFLRGIMAGLDKAFGTTIAGMVSSLCLSCLVLDARALGNVRFGTMRSFLLTRVLPYYSDDRVLLLERIIESSINRILPALIRDTSERLIDAAKFINKGAEVFSLSGEKHRLVAESVAEAIRQNSQLIEQFKSLALNLDNQMSAMIRISDVNSSTSAKLVGMQNAYHERISQIGSQLGRVTDAAVESAKHQSAQVESLSRQIREETLSLKESSNAVLSVTTDLNKKLDQFARSQDATRATLAKFERKMEESNSSKISADRLYREIEALRNEIHEHPAGERSVPVAIIRPESDSVVSWILKTLGIRR